MTVEEGRAERDKAFDLFEKHRAEWLAEARSAAYQLGRGGALVCIDDVRKVCPIPEGVDGRVAGKVFMEKGVWQSVKLRPSELKSSHARLINWWRLVDTPSPSMASLFAYRKG